MHLFLFRGLYILQLLLVAGNWELSRQEAEQNRLKWGQTFQLLTCCFLSPAHSYVNHGGLCTTVWLSAHSLPGGGSLVVLAIPWTIALQASLPMGLSEQEYWSGLPFPSPGDLPNPGIEPRSPAVQADSLPTELQGKPYHFILEILAQALLPQSCPS